MRVGLAGVWTVSDDACDGVVAPRRVLGAVRAQASLPETGSPTNRKIKLIGTNAVLKARCWCGCGLGGSSTISLREWYAFVTGSYSFGHIFLHCCQIFSLKYAIDRAQRDLSIVYTKMVIG